jgi:hypothetical protein
MPGVGTPGVGMPGCGTPSCGTPIPGGGICGGCIGGIAPPGIAGIIPGVCGGGAATFINALVMLLRWLLAAGSR